METRYVNFKCIYRKQWPSNADYQDNYRYQLALKSTSYFVSVYLMGAALSAKDQNS